MTAETAETFYQKGIQQDEQGQSQAAIISYTQAIDLEPGYTEAWIRRGLTLMTVKQFEPAIGNFNQAVALRSDSDLAWYLKAFCHALLGADDIALLALGKAIHLNPEQWSAMASQEPGFDTLRSDPRFQELVAR